MYIPERKAYTLVASAKPVYDLYVSIIPPISRATCRLGLYGGHPDQLHGLDGGRYT